MMGVMGGGVGVMMGATISSMCIMTGATGGGVGIMMGATGGRWAS